ncbi:MBL fold metallo-hydrolase [Thalassotalea nanhaiensis]|uniref:MBL fold metallo-hydrolase n=1 Tax=Thalassotalea nanhaiensis TaxID=3065648 RepID=A0ABY9TIY1_9GAMM|nr:MBL fold metallo-hydrolase [Colwelliaceae bacterium SQ345]
MKFSIIITSILVLIGCTSQSKVDAKIIPQSTTAAEKSTLAKQNWIHGSPDCDENKDSTVDVYQHDLNSYIIRQNKCLTFEAPFIYVLVGENSILVLDTGALEDEKFSIYEVIKNTLGKELVDKRKILVAHSHGHSDHYQGDDHFKGHANVTLIQPSKKSVVEFFGFEHWPNDKQTIDLGNRQITVIPTPGHQEQAITIYDHQTKWLMTGDTLYPGYIYVKEWDVFRESIARLATFANNNEISAIVGTHIESKNTPDSYYSVGTTYQPNEAKLDLSVQQLQLLNAKLKDTDEPQDIKFDNFIIKPLNLFQRMLSNVAGWFTSSD